MNTTPPKPHTKPTIKGISDEFGVIYSPDGKNLLSCSNDKLKIYDIEYGTRVIGEEAFAWCESLQQITIPNTVNRIEKGAFSWCKSLRQVIIPESVISIGEYAFGWCRSLMYIIIPLGSLKKYKKMLPEEMWEKLYYLKPAMKQNPEEELPF